MEFNLKTYKDVKRYDKEQMEKYVRSIYSTGFQDGVAAGAKADFKIKLVQVLKHTKGVGDKTIKKALVALKEMEG